jgi:hypothetical protein
MSSVTLVAAVGLRRYYVIQSASRMPNSCWGRYSHSAVVRVTGIDAPRPTAIRETATAHVCYDSGPGFDGRSIRCAAYRAYEHAIDLARSYADAYRTRLATDADQAYAASLEERSGEDL